MDLQHHKQISSPNHLLAFSRLYPSDFTVTLRETLAFSLPQQLPLLVKSSQNQQRRALFRMLIAIGVLCTVFWLIATIAASDSLDLLKNNKEATLYATQRQLLSNPTLPNIQKDRIPRWYNYQDPPQQPLSSTSQQQQDPIPTQEEQLRVIYDNDRQLDYEIVANITGAKKKLAEKLMTINSASEYNAKLISRFQQRYYQQKYKIDEYPEQSMCVIVPTFNNADNQRYRSNLISIIAQEYSNYKVIIVDDCSTDGTATLISDLLAEKRVDMSRFILVRNGERMMAMSNIRNTAKKYCNADDIMMIVDGDDQLVGRQVFKLFNAVLHKDRVWFAYSNFIDSNKKVGFSRAIPLSTAEIRKVRSQLFVTSHLRAFYVALFLKIQQKDLKNVSGEYFQAANDVAMCIPMLQMSGDRISYIPEITYVYESNTGNNNHLIRAEEQRSNDREIRRKPQYQTLPFLFSQ